MRWMLVLALAGALLPAQAATEADGIHTCAGAGQVSVRALALQDALAACDGATRALAFLARAGYQAPPSTRIDIVDDMPGDLAGKAVGCYVRESRQVLLLSFEAFRAVGGWFQMPPSWELYRAAASHEVAHAVVGCHSEPRRLPVAAHEYVAYVVFFATMEPSLRTALLAKYPGRGFRSIGQIRDLVHLVNPQQFGVDAWKHYQRMPQPAQWLARIIAGEVVPEWPDDPDASAR